MEALAYNSNCECFVNVGDIDSVAKQQDPIPCLASCKRQFLQEISPGWKEDSSWPQGCQNLTSATATNRFWSLYWCDSTFCGVAINQTGGLGQDPNVGLIINTCQNNGYHSVLDPGPPPATFLCHTNREAEARCMRTNFQVPGAPSSVSAAQLPTSVSSDAVPSTTSATPATPTASTSWTTSTLAGPTQGATSSSATYVASPTRLSSAGTGESTTSGSGLSGPAKIAIAACSAVGLVAIISLVLLCLYRRKRRKASVHRTLRSQLRLTQHIPSSGSPTPLISPANSAIGGGPPLTPPLRLRDRRFLPSILRPGNRSPSPPLTPLTPAYSPYNPSAVFPSSPICSPTTNKLVPRYERTPRPNTSSNASSSLPPIPPQIAYAVPGGGPNRGSLSSYGGASSTTGHSSLRNEIPRSHPLHDTSTHNNATAGPTPPSSPTRPPRPHDTPLEIPDLVSPASPSPSLSPLGPPPNRALPLPPGMMTSGSTASFTAVGGTPAVGMRVPPPPPPPPPIRSRSVGVQAPRVANEKEKGERGSWGSWSGREG
ncbi:hypothetical protein B0T25DRAFT_322026 [Lasiosphaeria hispida]|uniref:WSC domain-containing protein n=1 Tax=Lasiosphaeria hispida TaxID=260671 RepID=A0AAJ0H9F3_9PEZI|nr:hypothetical protein B0T25DRAFT_322026 [Lasiosphaeria hispida]